MVLGIRTNSMALNAYRSLSVAQSNVAVSVERIASGTRINSARDDSSGLSIASGIRSQVGGLTVAARNTQDAVSMLQIADGDLGVINDMLQRMRDLATQGMSSSSNHAALQTEYAALTAEITRVANSSKFNDIELLDGTFNQTFQIGPNSSDALTVTLGGVDATDLSIGVTTVSTTAAATTAQSAIDAAIATVASRRATTGANLSRLDYTADQINVAIENVAAAQSRIMDSDYATESIALTQAQILSEAGTAMLAQALAQPSTLVRLVDFLSN